MRAVAGRVGQALLTVLFAGIAVWALTLLVPGDPALRVLLGRGVLEPQPEQVAAVRAELGLDRPVPVRFWEWLGGALTGDLGISWRTGRPVVDEFTLRLPATLRLTVVALAIAVVLAVVLGMVAASAPRRWPDLGSRIIGLIMIATPGFLLAVLILDVVVLRLGAGRVISDGTWGTVGLPAATLALATAAGWSRILRAAVLEARGAPYLQVVAARGGSQRRLLWRHALPNALPPFLTVVGLGLAGLLGGAPIVESVYTWPGIGRYVVQSIDARDMPVVVAFTMLAVLTYVVASLLIDLLLRALDPRLRAAGVGA